MIIKSILDTDLYKYTMMYAVVKNFPSLKVKYKFNDRNKISFPKGFADALRFETILMETLKLTHGEKRFLQENLSDILPPTFIDLLDGYHYDSTELNITQDEEGHLEIEIEGYWYRTILWEVPLMALISELYFKITGLKADLFDKTLVANDTDKAHKLLKSGTFFADFGTRRRYSYDNQDRIIKLFKKEGGNRFVGTSNIHFAHKHGLKCTGTMAHEYIMVYGAVYGYKMANSMALNDWIDTYNGNLGTALSDTYTTDVFFDTFDMKMSKLYDGVRHDSGCPFKFADKVIAHYKSMGIDPMTKTIVFSDALTTELALSIKSYCIGKIKCSMGIGTHFTNDLKIFGITSLNMVIKISEVQVNGTWANAVKLSDDLGKTTGVIEEVNLCKQTLKL